MESTGSVPRNGNVRKTTHSRRSWTTEEEYVLLHTLKEIVVRGWKCDNGFKSGYQVMLEQSMAKAFPGTYLKAMPHINSKIHVWKLNYGSLSSMLARSGFAWNDSANTLIVKDEQKWNDYIKMDANAKTMRYKSWPYFKDWCEIFGKDRATGENAETFHNVIQDILSGAPQNDNNNTPRNETPQTPIPDEEADNASIFRGESSGTKKTKSSKKRKSGGDLEERFMDFCNTFVEKTEARLGDLAKRIGFEQDASASRKAVFEALSVIPGISAEDKIVVAKQLCSDTKLLDLFFSLDHENKALMVRMMCAGKI